MLQRESAELWPEPDLCMLIDVSEERGGFCSRRGGDGRRGWWNCRLLFYGFYVRAFYGFDIYQFLALFRAGFLQRRRRERTCLSTIVFI